MAEPLAGPPPAGIAPVEDERPPAIDADMPSLDSLGEDSDYAGFLSPRVSEGLRRAALRKLFHLPHFNVTDGLDDYAEDYRTFEALGDIVTADMRHRMELAQERLEEAMQPGTELSEAHDPASKPAADQGGSEEAPDGNSARSSSRAKDPRDLDADEGDELG